MRGVSVPPPRITSSTATLLVLLGLVVPLALLPSEPVRAAPGCPTGARVPIGQHIASVPWAQRRYQPQRLAGLADGARVTVAVIDSGVDAKHPQLRRAVLKGHDYLAGGDGRSDCVAHGTAVASIIAAAPEPDTGFAGLAPAAKVLPIRVTEAGEDTPAGRAGTAAGLAEAVDAAVRDGARVLNISMVLYRDDARVREAVRRAVRAGAVVVAAAGNGHGRVAGPDPVPYPAAYPGVIGVGAIDEQGRRLPESQVGSYVDIVAPGVDVTGAVPGSGLGYFSGTSFAAPFVSATAALILSRFPGSGAGDVTARLTGTADPAPDALPGGEYGYGVLNPYRAVTEVLPDRVPAGRASGTATGRARGTLTTIDPRTPALVLSGVAAATAAAVILLAGVLSRGARRRWRPGGW